MRDFLTQNTDAPSTSYPYGQGRDTNGSLGTWISNETWADLIHSLHKIANFASEAPDNTQDKNTPTNSNTIHNQQLIDAFAKFMFKVFGNNWKDRLNSNVIDELRARNIRLLVEGIENNLCFAVGDFYQNDLPQIGYRGHAADVNFLYLNNVLSSPTNYFTKYDSSFNVIDTIEWTDDIVKASNIRILDKGNDKIIYYDVVSYLIYDFTFTDNSYHNIYTPTAAHTVQNLICDNGIVYVLDAINLLVIVYSSFSRLEITRYSLIDNEYAPMSLAVEKNTLIVTRNNGDYVYIEHYEIDDTITLINSYLTDIDVIDGNFYVKVRLLNGFIYLLRRRGFYVLDLEGNKMYFEEVTTLSTPSINNITLFDNKILVAGTIGYYYDLHLTLNSAG